MSVNMTGSSSLYFQALQVQKAAFLGGHKVDTTKTHNTLVFSESYKLGEIDPTPKKEEKHNIDFIA